METKQKTTVFFTLYEKKTSNEFSLSLLDFHFRLPWCATSARPPATQRVLVDSISVLQTRVDLL